MTERPSSGVENSGEGRIDNVVDFMTEFLEDALLMLEHGLEWLEGKINSWFEGADFSFGFGEDAEGMQTAVRAPDLPIRYQLNSSNVMQAMVFVGGSNLIIGVDTNQDGQVDQSEIDAYLDANPEAASVYRTSREALVATVQNPVDLALATNRALLSGAEPIDGHADNGNNIGLKYTNNPREYDGIPNLKPRCGDNVYTSGVPGRLHRDIDGDGDSETHSTPERVMPNIIDARNTYGVVRYFSLDHHEEMREGIQMAANETGLTFEHGTGIVRRSAEDNVQVFADACSFYQAGDCIFHCSWGAHRAVITHLVCHYLSDPNFESSITDQDRADAEASGRTPEFHAVARMNGVEYPGQFGDDEMWIIEMFDDLVGRPDLQEQIRSCSSVNNVTIAPE